MKQNFLDPSPMARRTDGESKIFPSLDYLRGFGEQGAGFARFSVVVARAVFSSSTGFVHFSSRSGIFGVAFPVMYTRGLTSTQVMWAGISSGIAGTVSLGTRC